MASAKAARIVAYPVRGSRRWCFDCIPPPPRSGTSSTSASKGILDLWAQVRAAAGRHRVELVTHYAADKMHEKWVSLQSAPEGTIRQRIHSMGQKLLSRIEPSEHLFKTIPADAGIVELIFPASINPRLVRRRVRHLAISGAVYHQRLFYGSIGFLPFTLLIGLLPFPNVFLFWNLFRAYGHWKALQGSKKLEILLSDSCQGEHKPKYQTWLTASQKLEELAVPSSALKASLSDPSIASICKLYNLEPSHAMKWRDLQRTYFKVGF